MRFPFICGEAVCVYPKIKHVLSIPPPAPFLFFSLSGLLFRGCQVFALSKICGNYDLCACLCLWGQPKDFAIAETDFFWALNIPHPIKFKKTYILQEWPRLCESKQCLLSLIMENFWGFGSWGLFAWRFDSEHSYIYSSELNKHTQASKFHKCLRACWITFWKICSSSATNYLARHWNCWVKFYGLCFAALQTRWSQWSLLTLKYVDWVLTYVSKARVRNTGMWGFRIWKLVQFLILLSTDPLIERNKLSGSPKNLLDST